MTFLVAQWIHLASLLALEGLGELLEVGEGAPDPVVGGGVGPQEDAHLEVAWPVFGAPHVGRTDPEQLAGREVEAGQEGLRSVLGHPGLYRRSSRVSILPARMSHRMLGRKS